MKDLSISDERLDSTVEQQLEGLHATLEKARSDDKKADILFKIGKIHMAMFEVHEAADYIERGLQLRPDDVDMKVAFAEATIKRDEYDKLKVRGRKQRVAAYEVLGIRDVMLDREKIPESFYKKYRQVAELIDIPEDVILPVEALDGSIGHGKIVSLLSYAIAAQLGASEQEKMDILRAGYVADIGKENIPHHLLNRVGGLSADELKEVQQHPIEGPRILKKMGYDSEAMLDIVRHSHECFDGSGYPDGLRGEMIPLGARILAVADAYDALTSWRPYRERWECNTAFDELRRAVEKGVFDPNILGALTQVLGNTASTSVASRGIPVEAALS
jgi:HD-GYP domain-containing protein (c-di-GMP phosphodiesterase class II)